MSIDDEAPAEGWDVEPETATLAILTAPWGREVTLTAATWGSGMRLLRMRIRERRRFTDLDLDEATVRALIATMQGWLDGRDHEDADEG